MRRLTKVQHEFLEKLADRGITILREEDLVFLESINDYETLHQDAQRKLHDEMFKAKNR